jgi:hypothetical protein
MLFPQHTNGLNSGHIGTNHHQVREGSSALLFKLKTLRNLVKSKEK